MIEVVAAVSIANSAFTALKAGIARGQELRDMASSLSKFWDANDKIIEAKIENETASVFTKAIKGQSIEAQAMEITIAKHKAAQMEKELREFLIYSGQGEFYRDMLRERSRIRNERLRLARLRAQQKKDIIDIGLLLGAVFIGGIALMITINAIASIG